LAAIASDDLWSEDLDVLVADAFHGGKCPTVNTGIEITS
jgi:hypothetical protein